MEFAAFVSLAFRLLGKFHEILYSFWNSFTKKANFYPACVISANFDIKPYLQDIYSNSIIILLCHNNIGKLDKYKSTGFQDKGFVHSQMCGFFLVHAKRKYLTVIVQVTDARNSSATYSRALPFSYFAISVAARFSLHCNVHKCIKNFVYIFYKNLVGNFRPIGDVIRTGSHNYQTQKQQQLHRAPNCANKDPTQFNCWQLARCPISRGSLSENVYSQ